MYRAIANNINDGQAAPDSHLPCSPDTVLTLLPARFLAPKTTAHKASFAIISSLCCCWSSSCLWCGSNTRRCVSWLDLISIWSLGPCTSMDTNRLSVSMASGTHALPLPFAPCSCYKLLLLLLLRLVQIAFESYFGVIPLLSQPGHHC